MSEVHLVVRTHRGSRDRTVGSAMRVARSLGVEYGEIKIAPENDRSWSKMSEQIVFQNNNEPIPISSVMRTDEQRPMDSVTG